MKIKRHAASFLKLVALRSPLFPSWLFLPGLKLQLTLGCAPH
jgi:hypothetical protein